MNNIFVEYKYKPNQKIIYYQGTPLYLQKKSPWHKYFKTIINTDAANIFYEQPKIKDVTVYSMLYGVPVEIPFELDKQNGIINIGNEATLNSALCKEHVLASYRNLL